MTIRVHYMTQKYFKLFIDGKDVTPWGGYKSGIKKYLFRNYGVDLINDPTIIKNYTEYKYKTVRLPNGDTAQIKSKR